MNIKEYIKIQAQECSHDVMKKVFISLENQFFPKPIEKSKSIVVHETKSNDIKLKPSSYDTLFKRKVVVNLPDNKKVVGLIDNDGYDIKLANKSTLEFKMISGEHTFYYANERLFYRENNSRVIKMIDQSNYQKFYSDICWIKDYAMDEKEKVRIY